MNTNSSDIIIDHLSKRYHSHGKGIEDISFHIERGKITVLLGPNGSGKSTLLKCIMGMVKYQGKILKSNESIGYVPENYCIPDYITGIDFLNSLGRIKKNKENTGIINDLAKSFEINHVMHRPMKNYSHGMKQKINLIQGIIHHPRILLLDEPYRGIDESSRKYLNYYIKEHFSDSYVVISTHQLEFLEEFEDKKIVCFNQGRIEYEK